MKMKSYVSETQLRMVGKGWEIRERLRKLKESAGGPAELVTLLPQLIGECGQAEPPHGRQRTQPRKTADRRVIVFPSF